MTRQRTPQVTEAEVLDFLTEDGYARTAPEIAHNVWWQRGGTGDPAEATRHGHTPRVPVVRNTHVQPVLDALVARGAVVRATGSEVNEVGSPYQGYRDTWTYYTTREHADTHRAHLAQRRALAARDVAAADALFAAFTGHALRAEVDQPGEVRLVFTTDQAEQWCDRLATSFTPDEVDALVITAADAVHGDPDDLSERQRDLAGRVHTLRAPDDDSDDGEHA